MAIVINIEMSESRVFLAQFHLALDSIAFSNQFLVGLNLNTSQIGRIIRFNSTL